MPSACTRSSSSAAGSARARACSRSARARVRRPGVSSTSALTRSSQSSRTRISRATSPARSATAWTSALTTLEDAELRESSFDLAAAASSFHWVDEAIGLANGLARASARRLDRALVDRLRRRGAARTPFIATRRPSCSTDCRQSPVGSAPGGRTPHARTEARRVALVRSSRPASWTCRTSGSRGGKTWDTEGIRALFGTFSPILVVERERRNEILDEIARIARDEFGGRVRSRS